MFDAESFSGLVPIGSDRSIYLRCTGIGGPVVILESGYGHSGRVWETDILPQSWRPPPAPRTTVFDGVRAFTRVCLYDRPGTVLPVDGELRHSRSDPVPMPRSAGAMVDDLHAALAVAGISGPYVFVGHSLGGVLGRVFAARYPGEIAGMVLVDSFSAGLWEDLAASLSPLEWAAMQALESEPRRELQRIYSAAELIDMDAIAAADHAAAIVPMPMTVLTRGRPLTDVVPPEMVPVGFRWDIVEATVMAAQRRLARSTPGTRHEIVESSGHLIQLDQPGRVIEAIRLVVNAVRNPNAWVPTTTTP